MPEGPEIKYISKLLNKICKNKILNNLSIINGPYLNNNKKMYSSEREKIYLLENQKVIDVISKGKYLFFVFEDQLELAVHAGMEGSWSTVKDKHTLFIFNFENDFKLYFQDTRRFSKIKILKEEDIINFKNKIGIDIFNIDFQNFKKNLLRSKKQVIHRALMKQDKISGIGNYLRADIMYSAKICPNKIISDLTEEEIKKLYNATKEISQNSYNHKATTCGNYDNTIHYGGYKPLIYGRNKTELNENIETFIDKDKRKVWWVPSVQI